MCRFWRRERCNHHFPELNKKTSMFRGVKKLFTTMRVASILTVVIVGIGFVYLTQTNVSATQGYQIRELEDHIENLQKQNKRLNLEYIELQSMANIIERAEGLDLVAIDDVEVISSVGSSVALR
jgi:cell division protein FtsL